MLTGKMIAKFHIADGCNLRCDDCHWFSQPVIDPGFMDAHDAISWCRRWHDRISDVRLTGGEPTLHPDFTCLVDSLQLLRLPIRIYTNGTNPEKLAAIGSPCDLFVGINRPILPSELLILKNLHHRVIFQSFLPRYASDGVKKIPNQLLGPSNLKIGSRGRCRSNSIRFASDGHAYRCEIGLRSKDPNLRCGFSLKEGEPSLSSHRCLIAEACLSCIPSENEFDLHPEDAS